MSRRRYGDQRACTRCGMDVEWHGEELGWIGRGGDQLCANSGAHPVVDRDTGERGMYPYKPHTVPADR